MSGKQSQLIYNMLRMWRWNASMNGQSSDRRYWTNESYA
jgi:hypothetical protein